MSHPSTSDLARLPGPLRFEVRHSWDGTPRPVPPGGPVRWWLDAIPEGLSMAVEAPFWDDPAPPGKPGADGLPEPGYALWEHEVVELFIAGRGEPGPDPTVFDPTAPDPLVPYTEIELSPHGFFLVLRLAGVRRVVESGLPLEVETHIAGNRWRGEAVVPWSYLPSPPHRLNAYALHGVGASRRYLALAPVPGTAPDFHQPERFVPIRRL